MKPTFRLLLTLAFAWSLLASNARAGAPVTAPAPETPTSEPPAVEMHVCVVDVERQALAQRLVELGHTPEEAIALVVQLTDADLAVLSENPRMVQRAGTMSNLTEAYVIGAIIIAGIVILAVSGNGFVNVN